MPREPIDETVVKRAMWVEHKYPTPALAPGNDVLSDEVFEKFAFAGPGAAADVEVLVPERAWKS